VRTAKATLLAIGIPFLAVAIKAQGAPQAPLKLIQSIPLPGVTHFEHFEVDAKGGRLFSLSGVQDSALDVFDLHTNKHLHRIQGLKEGQCSVYREDLNRLYIAGGGGNLLTKQPGRIWIYDAKDYSLIQSLDVPPGAAWCGYDPATKYLYVNGNGRLVNKPDSTVTIVDTSAAREVSQFLVNDDLITDFQLETSSPNMYTGERNKKLIAVIDRNTQRTVAMWPLTLGEGLGHMALDRKHHRLFVSCRYGQIVIFDTQTGKELQALPINQYADDLQYDSDSQRLYATCAGAVGVGQSTVDVFQRTDSDHYRLLGQVPTEHGARNGILVPQLARFFVAVPQSDLVDSHLLVFAVQ
jgi:DNA-binding beta-propeller fold protein YncE